MALILNIETTTTNCSVCIAKEGAVIAQKSLNNKSYSHSESLHVFIEELISDSHFAIKEVVTSLLKLNILPIIIGGGQDATFSNYKAYDKLEQTVNLVTVDNMFDLGNIDDELSLA